MKKSLSLLLLAVSFAGCSSSDDEKNQIELISSDASLNYGEEFQIEAKSDLKITYSSENTYHASVSEEGVVKAGRVGETNILLTNEKDIKKLKVTVKPKSNVYPEPSLEFGISRSDLIKKLGTPSQQTENGMSYDDYSTNAPQAIYLFDENNKLTSSSVFVRSSQSSNLGTFLGERYVPVTSKDYTIFFVNAIDSEKVSMAVGANLYNVNYWLIMYYPFSTAKTKSQNSPDDLMKEIEKLFKE